MPTAGEYKHEPCGIPCHCYVRRRLHHSTCRKSCLRKQSDSSSQSCADTKSKKVTFDPILRIRSYENLKDLQSDSTSLLRPASPAASRKNDAASSNTPGIYDKITSLLGLNQSCRPCQCHKHDASIRGDCDQPSRRDRNNNSVDRGDTKMNAKCPICESKRHKSPVRGFRYQQTRERSPSPCGFHQPYQTINAAEPSQYQRPTSSRITPSVPARAKYHVPRRLFGQDSGSETSSQKDSSGGYEHMNTLTYVASTSTDLDGSSVYINGENDSKIPRPISIFIKGDRQEDKLEEYFYEVPINNTNDEAEYDYVTINGAQRTPRTGQSTQSFSRLIKHKTEADLTSKNVQDYTLRPKNPTRRSAPDLRSVATPYDIHFVDKRSKRSREAGVEQVEIFGTASGTQDKLQINRVNKSFRSSSAVVDILKMTPIAFFWTGCAFLIAMMYIFLFPCPYEHN